MNKEICLVKPKEKEKPLPFYVKTYEREILNGPLLYNSQDPMPPNTPPGNSHQMQRVVFSSLPPR